MAGLFNLCYNVNMDEEFGDAASIIGKKIEVEQADVPEELRIAYPQGKLCVYMCRGAGSYRVGEITFTPEAPFQMMEEAQANELMSNNPDRFRMANKQEVVDFYTKKAKFGKERMKMV